MRKLLVLLLLVCSSAFARDPWYNNLDLGGSPFAGTRGYADGGVTFDGGTGDGSFGGNVVIDGTLTTGVFNPSTIMFSDDEELIFGTDSDVKIDWDSSASLLYFRDTGDVLRMSFNPTNGNIVITGTSDLQSNIFDSVGILTFADDVLFQTASDTTTSYQFLDANGGTPILNIDAVNERVGFGTATPGTLVEVQGGVLTQSHGIGGSGAITLGGETGSAVAMFFGLHNNPDLYMKFGTFAGANSMDIKAFDLSIFSTARAGIFRLDEATGLAEFGYDVAISGDDFDLNKDGTSETVTTDVGDGSGPWIVNTGLFHLFENATVTGAFPILKLENNSAGNDDIAMQFILTGEQTWQMGIDNSDNEFKLRNSSTADWTGAGFRLNSAGRLWISGDLQTDTDLIAFGSDLVLGSGDAVDKTILADEDGTDGLITWAVASDWWITANTWVFGSAANGTNFATDGRQTMTGTAKVAKHVILSPGNIAHPSANPPTSQVVGNAFVDSYDADVDKQTYAIWHIEADYEEGTDIHFHFHWAPSDGTTNTVTWGIEWVILDNDSNEVLTAGTTTQIVTDDSQGLQDELLQTDDITISGTGFAHPDILLFRIFRDADASEGGADDDYAADAHLIAAAIEYMCSQLGEDEQW